MKDNYDDEDEFDFSHDKQMRKDVLEAAISLCKENLFWSWLSADSKLAAVTKAYRTMIALLHGN